MTYPMAITGLNDVWGNGGAPMQQFGESNIDPNPGMFWQAAAQANRYRQPPPQLSYGNDNRMFSGSPPPQSISPGYGDNGGMWSGVDRFPSGPSIPYGNDNSQFQMPPPQSISPGQPGGGPLGPQEFWAGMRAPAVNNPPPPQSYSPAIPGMDPQMLQMAMMGDFSQIQQQRLKEQQMLKQQQMREAEWNQKMQQQAELHQQKMTMMQGAGFQAPQQPQALGQWNNMQSAGQLMRGQGSAQMTNPFQQAYGQQVENAFKQTSSPSPSAGAGSMTSGMGADTANRFNSSGRNWSGFSLA